MRPARTQRWRDGTHSWRPAEEGGFNPDHFEVVTVDHSTAAAFVRRHHYAKSWPSTSLAFALHDHRRGPRTMAGIIALGTPMSQGALTKPFPTLLPSHESLDWSRLVVLDDVPANGESWFAAEAFRLAAAHGVRGIVTFADPLPRWRRTPAGLDEVKPGHVGIVYQALNMTYLGRATPRTLVVLPDATVLTARAISKLTRRERGAAGVVRRLIGLGAPRPHDHDDAAAWLATALGAIGAYRQRHPGNHRYALRIGNRRQRTRTVIAMPAAAYPKPELLLPLAGLPGQVASSAGSSPTTTSTSSSPSTTNPARPAPGRYDRSESASCPPYDVAECDIEAAIAARDA